MVSPAQTHEFLAFADRLADAARDAILPYFRTALEVESKTGLKPGYDPVTAADKASERAMRALIEETYPGHGILGEEFGAKPARDGLTWVLDPIDGTRAFISGLPLWGVLIGLCAENRPIIGVIDQPYIGERFRGWPGGADFTNRLHTRPLRVSACAQLQEAKIATTDPNLFSAVEAGGFERLRAAARLTRYGCDCYAYAMLAGGFLDIVLESGLAPWDVAALIPVIEGAGGFVTDWRGEPVWAGGWFSRADGRGRIIAAGDRRVHAEALTLLVRAAAD